MLGLHIAALVYIRHSKHGNPKRRPSYMAPFFFEIYTFELPKNRNKKIWVEIMLSSIVFAKPQQKIHNISPRAKKTNLASFQNFESRHCSLSRTADLSFCVDQNTINSSLTFYTIIDLNIIFTQNFCFDFLDKQKCRFQKKK